MTTHVRTLGALLLAAIAALILLDRTPFLAAEAGAAARVAGVLPGAAIAVGPRLFVGVGTPDVLGMQITPLCSTVILAAPVLLVGAALLLGLRWAHVHRIALGVAAGLVLVVVANQARYLLLGWLGLTYGRTGFLLGHHWVGALGVLVAFAAALFLTVRIAASGVTHTGPAASQN